MSTNFIEISKNIIGNIERIDDLVDSYFDPIKDLTDTAQDIFAPIKAVHSLYVLNRKRKFKKFLKAYAESLKDFRFNNDDQVNKLKSYLKNEKNFNFLQTTIENALNSKSVYGSVLLGYFAGLILSKDLEIGFKELIKIEGIKELNDIEFSCFAKIYKCADLSKEVNIKDYKQLKGYEFFCELTIDKLIQLRMVEKPIQKYNGGSKGEFFSSDVSEEIIELMKDVNIFDEIANYL